MEATKRLANIELNTASMETIEQIEKALNLFPEMDVMLAKRNFFADYMVSFLSTAGISNDAIAIMSGLIKTDFVSLNTLMTRAAIVNEVKMSLLARDEQK